METTRVRVLSQPPGETSTGPSSRDPDARASDAQASAPASPLSLIARNAPLVILGEAVPLAAAVVAMPLLLAGLGVDRLGVLSLAWVVIGYFSLFDLGIGRATTQLIAARVGAGRHDEVQTLVRTALVLLLVLGCAGGAVLAALASWLVVHVLAVPPGLVDETRTTMLLLALIVPLVVVGSGLRGVLEAERRFAAVAALRAALGLISFLAPLAVLPLAPTLPAVVLVIGAGRVLLLAVMLVLCRDTVTWHAQRPDRAVARELLRFGGWLTVTNAVGPVLVFLDRFVVGAVVSVGAVAFYSTPLEVVQRAGIVPIAIGTVLFPALAASALHDARHARALFATALRLCLIGVLPLLLGIVLWAPEALQLWLGDAFARESASVVRWVAPGLLLNAIGCAALFALQAAGRPDVGAKLHVVELLFYAPLLWWLASRYGLEGAAIAWSLRVGADAVLLLAFANRRFPLAPATLVWVLVAALLGLAALAAASAVASLGVKIVATVVVAVAAASLAPRLLAAARAGRSVA